MTQIYGLGSPWKDHRKKNSMNTHELIYCIASDIDKPFCMEILFPDDNILVLRCDTGKTVRDFPYEIDVLKSLRMNHKAWWENEKKHIQKLLYPETEMCTHRNTETAFIPLKTRADCQNVHHVSKHPYLKESDGVVCYEAVWCGACPHYKSPVKDK